MRPGLISTEEAFGKSGIQLEKRIMQIGWSDTPFLSTIGAAAPMDRSSNVALGHQWTYDVIPDGTLDNAHLEGGEMAELKKFTGGTLKNHYQIVKDTYVAGSFLVLILSVFIALIVAGFLTPVVANEIKRRHYRNLEISEISTARSVKLIGAVLLKFTAISLISLPFLFVPILNLFIIQLPFFYLYYALLLVDVGSNTLSEKRFELVWMEGGGYEYKFTALIFYLLCLIPLVGLFLQIFFVIYFSHFFFQKERFSLT